MTIWAEYDTFQIESGSGFLRIAWGDMGTHSADIPVGHWFPNCDAERNAVRAQLERVLASHLFANSRRYPALLRYVVEESLSGRTDNLKERTLGVDVFKRDSQYDSNLDPVVRVTAGEVRKRLAQYYYEPGHESELHIELPSGSYVPVYRVPDPHSKAFSEHLQQVPFVPEYTEAHFAAAPQGSAIPAGTAIAPTVRKRGAARAWLSVAVVSALLAVVAGFVIVHRSRTASQEILNQFWGPIVNSSDTAILCLGDRASWDSSQAATDPNNGTARNITVGEFIESQGHVVMTDVLTMDRLAATLQTLGKQYRIKNASDTDLADLRSGPVILIGIGNNSWTLRVTDPLRFSFVMDSVGGRIIDKKALTQTSWAVPLSTPYRQLKEDYGIVARFKDPTTDRFVVVAGGLAAQGTIAAGEMISNPEYLKSLFSRAPDGWQHKNMEAVITTEVINGEGGPPRVLAVDFW